MYLIWSADVSIQWLMGTRGRKFGCKLTQNEHHGRGGFEMDPHRTVRDDQVSAQ